MKNKKNKNFILSILFPVICISGCIIVFAAATFFTIKTSKSKVDNSNKKIVITKEKVLDFYLGNKLYSINFKKNYIHIDLKDVVMCIQAPCNPIKRDEFKIDYKDEYYDLINNLFGEKDYLSLYDKDIDRDNKILLYEIVGEKYEDDLEYKVLDNDYYSNYKERGYKLIKNKDKYNLIISLGEKGTGGYSIDIVNIQVSGNNVTVYLDENEPGEKDVVTQAFTYPSVTIEFNGKPRIGDIYIVNKNEYLKEIR